MSVLLRRPDQSTVTMSDEDAAYWLKNSRYVVIDRTKDPELSEDAEKVLAETNPVSSAEDDFKEDEKAPKK